MVYGRKSIETTELYKLSMHVRVGSGRIDIDNKLVVEISGNTHGTIELTDINDLYVDKDGIIHSRRAPYSLSGLKHVWAKPKKKRYVVIEQYLINELWNNLEAKGTVPTLTIRDKQDLWNNLKSAMEDGFSVDPDGIADEATKFNLDERNASFYGIDNIIEYQNVTERDEDGEPQAWETVGYEYC